MHNIIYKETEYQECENTCEISIRFHKITDKNMLLLLSQKEDLGLGEKYQTGMYGDAIQSCKIKLIETFHALEIIISCETFLTEYILEIIYEYLQKNTLIDQIEYTLINKYLEGDFFLDAFLDRCTKENIKYNLTTL